MADVQNIKTSDKVFLLEDKTTNIYKVSVDLYKKLILNNVTNDYIQISEENVDRINEEAAILASELELADRIEKYSETPCYVSIKDHKSNFKTDPKCRLINPAKSQIGKISKQILQSICTDVRLKTKINQWQSTNEVLDWLKNILLRSRKFFLQFDIVEFYPLISKELLDNALDFASELTTISDLDQKSSNTLGKLSSSLKPPLTVPLMSGRRSLGASMSPWVLRMELRFVSSATRTF